MSTGRRRTGAAVALAAALAGVGPTPASAARPADPYGVDRLQAALEAPGPPGAAIAVRRPGPSGALVAKLLEPTAARSRPGGRVLWRAATRTRYAGQATRLAVDAARYDAYGRAWVRVLLPRRPNGTRGWIPASGTVVAATPWAVRVRLGRRQVDVLHGGRVVRRLRAVVGAPGTPTPRGRFAIYETTHQRDPRGFIGSGALHTTAFSEVLDDFGGGPGVVAIHGRGPAALGDPLGSARSHGCVRVDDAALRWMRARLAPGTPVRITG